MFTEAIKVLENAIETFQDRGKYYANLASSSEDQSEILTFSESAYKYFQKVYALKHAIKLLNDLGDLFNDLEDFGNGQ